MSSDPARLSFGLSPAISLRKQSRKSGRSKNFKRVKIVAEPGREKKIRCEKQRSSQSAWKLGSRGVSTGLRLSCLPAKQRELKHGQLEGFGPRTMPVRYEMRCYPTDVNVWAVKNSRLLLAVLEKVLDSGRFALAASLRSAFIDKKHGGNIFFVAEEVKFLRKMDWVCRAYQYAREKSTEGEDKRLF